MDTKRLDFKCNIYGVNIGSEIISGEAEKYLDKKLMDLYNRDTIIKYSIGCKDENQEDPIYFELVVFDRNSGKVYYLYFILKTTMENINQNIYQIIEAKIREEVRNNRYSDEDKEIIKLFIEKYGKRTKEEIADIFNEKEPKIITTEIIEETIIQPFDNLKCGLINYKCIDDYKVISKIISQIYKSAAIDGSKGEISDKELYCNNILPFESIKDNLVSDFYNYSYYSGYMPNNNLLVCIYESILNDLSKANFIRYLAPIKYKNNSLQTVLEATNEYFDNISGRVSNEYQRRIDAFQKKYKR